MPTMSLAIEYMCASKAKVTHRHPSKDCKPKPEQSWGINEDPDFAYYTKRTGGNQMYGVARFL